MTPELEERELDLRDYLRVLARRWRVVALTVVVLAAVVVGMSLLETPVYEATAEVLVKTRPSQLVVTSANVDQFNAQRAVDTEIQLLQSRTVQDAAERKLGHKPDVSVAAIGQTDVVSISARSTDAKRAAGDATTYARTYISVRRAQSVDDLTASSREVQSRIDHIQQQLDALPAASPDRDGLQRQADFYRNELDQFLAAASVAQVGGGEVVTAPEVPKDPIKPTPLKNGLIAVFFGLMFGVVFAFVREHLDDTVKFTEDLEKASGLPVLGIVPSIADWKDPTSAYLVAVERANSPAAEAYRTLRTAVKFLAIEEPIRVLQVTSAGAGEGKTATIANLATTLARADQRVIVVDCDLRHPRLHEFFGFSNNVGFTSVLLGEAQLAQAVQSVASEPRLAVLTSGPRPPDPSELLSLPSTARMLEMLRTRCDILLIDTPPVLPVSDPLIVSHYVDATLIIARAGFTSRRRLHRAVEMLLQVDAPLVGTVLNDIDAKLADVEFGRGRSVASRRRSSSEHHAEAAASNGSARTPRRV